MKRFFSVLLVAILLVTSLATSAMAVEGTPGGTYDISITVKGEFANFLVAINASSGLTIKSINGAGGSVVSSATTGKANWAGAGNVDSFTFTVTVQVAENIAPGTYYVSAVAERASKAVPMEEDTEDGVENGLVATTVSVSGGSITITCDHEWDDGVVTKEATCTEDGVKTYTCSKCGETKTEAIPATGHKAEKGWIYDDDTHWHKCANCGEIIDEADHINDVTGQKIPTPEEDGYLVYGCVICGRYDHTELWPYGKPPKVGDIRPMMILGFSAVLFTMAAAAYVFKRKVNA